MARFPELDPADMTDEQKRVAEAIAAGPRGSVRGPFHALLYSPPLADRVQALGAYVRYDCSIPWHLREIAILVTAKHWNAQYEWYAHEKEAQKAEVGQDIIDAIRDGVRPEFGPDRQAEEDIYDFATELYSTRAISDETFTKAEARFGKEGVVELGGLLGHYNVIAITLNIAQIPVPGGELPLK